MKERSGMPYDVVAYEADEAAMLLTAEQEGYFHRLLRRSWMNGSIPDDVVKIAKICRAPSLKRMRQAWVAIRPLWVESGEQGRLQNSKQEKERLFFQSRQATAKTNANRRWDKAKENKETDDATAMPPQCNGNASHPIPSPSPSTVPIPKDKSNTEKGSRCIDTAKTNNKPHHPKTDPPDEFGLTQPMWDWAADEGFTVDLVRKETAKMLDHFKGKGEQKADWVATWRNWMRNSSKFNGGNGNNGRPSESKAESIVRKNRESGQFVRDSLRGTTGDGNGAGDPAGTHGLLRPRPRGH